jgi:hypothetical protein
MVVSRILLRKTIFTSPTRLKNLSGDAEVVRFVNIGKSQPAKNRNLNQLISNLNRLNWSSEHNCVYCFSTVFTLLQQGEVPSVCLSGNLPSLVFESSNTFLTYTCDWENWSVKLFICF